MKIKIKAVNDKNFYQELINVMFDYKNVSKKKKIRNNIKFYKITMIILILIALFLASLKLIANKGNNYVLFFDLFVFFLELFILLKMNSMLRNYLNDHNDSEFIINKEEITLNKENESSVSIKWDALDFILVGQYGIMFISKDSTGIIIDIPIKYLDEVKECISKMHKDIKIFNS